MKAKILKKENSLVQLEVLEGKDACSSCGLCFLGKKAAPCILSVRTDKPFAPGDIVELEYSEGRGVLMAFLLFFLPAAILIGTIALCLKRGLTEASSAASGLAAFILYFFLIQKKDVRGIQIRKI